MSPSCPKPSRAAAKKRRHAARKDVQKIRAANAQIAVLRDRGLCVICYFRDGIEKPYDDVHHVYGRAVRSVHNQEEFQTEYYWREHYTSMMSVCRICHPQPILGLPGSSAHLGWVEEYLRRANETPINEEFKHAPKQTDSD